MSVATWKAKYYPTPASKATKTELQAAKHSLRKWTGMTAEALEAEGLKKGDEPVRIGGSTCALCQRHTNPITINDGGFDCGSCILAKVSGKQCDDFGSEYWKALGGNPRPLINQLAAAVAKLESESKQKSKRMKK